RHRCNRARVLRGDGELHVVAFVVAVEELQPERADRGDRLRDGRAVDLQLPAAPAGARAIGQRYGVAGDSDDVVQIVRRLRVDAEGEERLTRAALVSLVRFQLHLVGYRVFG